MNIGKQYLHILLAILFAWMAMACAAPHQVQIPDPASSAQIHLDNNEPCEAYLIGRDADLARGVLRPNALACALRLERSVCKQQFTTEGYLAGCDGLGVQADDLAYRNKHDSLLIPLIQEFDLHLVSPSLASLIVVEFGTNGKKARQAVRLAKESGDAILLRFAMKEAGDKCFAGYKSGWELALAECIRDTYVVAELPEPEDLKANIYRRLLRGEAGTYSLRRGESGRRCKDESREGFYGNARNYYAAEDGFDIPGIPGDVVKAYHELEEHYKFDDLTRDLNEQDRGLLAYAAGLHLYRLGMYYKNYVYAARVAHDLLSPLACDGSGEDYSQRYEFPAVEKAIHEALLKAPAGSHDAVALDVARYHFGDHHERTIKIAQTLLSRRQRYIPMYWFEPAWGAAQLARFLDQSEEMMVLAGKAYTYAMDPSAAAEAGAGKPAYLPAAMIAKEFGLGQDRVDQAARVAYTAEREMCPIMAAMIAGEFNLSRNLVEEACGAITRESINEFRCNPHKVLVDLRNWNPSIIRSFEKREEGRPMEAYERLHTFCGREVIPLEWIPERHRITDN